MKPRTLPQPYLLNQKREPRIKNFCKSRSCRKHEGFWKPEYPARGFFQPGVCSSQGSVPARGCIQARASSKPEVVPGEGFFQSGQGVFLLRVVPAGSLFQPGACASEGFVPATGWFQPREFHPRVFRGVILYSTKFPSQVGTKFVL